jgi:flagellin
LTDTVGDKEITLTYGNTISDPAKLGINTRTTANDITGATIATATQINAGDITINGVEIDETATAATVAANVTLLNKFSDETGVVASQTGSVITLNSVTGEEISIDYLDGSESTVAGILGGILETNNAESSGDTVSNIDISTAAGAQSAIGTIDAALEQINATRGDLGAVSNRLDFTVNNLSNVSENVAAARSRIEDADFAAESAALSRAQVLQQAGTAMLAQANAAPQQVLSLLQ